MTLGVSGPTSGTGPQPTAPCHKRGIFADLVDAVTNFVPVPACTRMAIAFRIRRTIAGSNPAS